MRVLGRWMRLLTIPHQSSVAKAFRFDELVRLGYLSAFDAAPTQRTRALALLKRRGMARLAEFHEAGVTAAASGKRAAMSS